MVNNLRKQYAQFLPSRCYFFLMIKIHLFITSSKRSIIIYLYIFYFPLFLQVLEGLHCFTPSRLLHIEMTAILDRYFSMKRLMPVWL